MAEKDKKYGLIDPKKKLTVADVFKNESDDETPGPKQGSEKGLKKQTVIDMNRALMDDPTVYQYDEIYDTMKKVETDSNKPKEERKTKYMDALMKSADRRKKENERRTEKLVQKEREAEGETYKDKEEFITSSYRKKLEENKLAEEEEKKMEYIESVMDVSKQPDLGSFYRHLYKETVPQTEALKDNKAEVIKLEAGEEIKDKKASSSSSSGTDSSTDSSSSDSSSSEEDQVSKSTVLSSLNVKEAKNKILEDGEIPSPPEEDRTKQTEMNNKTLKFGSSRRDRPYRQRDSTNKDHEVRKSRERETLNNGRQEERRRVDDNRDRHKERERDRDRERDRIYRNDNRSSLAWRSNERSRDDRKNSRRQRSRSRSNRDRNSVVKKERPGLSDNRRKDKELKSSNHKELHDKNKEAKGKNSQKTDKDIKVYNEPLHNNADENKIIIKENIEVLDIWKKRTVGAVLDAALERYYQRKAARRSL